MYLLDTNVVSELRRARPHGAVVAWLKSLPDSDLYVSAVTIGEIQIGIEKTRAQDPVRADEIEAWLEQVSTTYNVLSMDAPAFRLWAKLMHGKSADLIADAMIAATAAIHNLTIATRNVRDFQALGAPTLNPFIVVS